MVLEINTSHRNQSFQTSRQLPLMKKLITLSLTWIFFIQSGNLNAQCSGYLWKGISTITSDNTVQPSLLIRWDNAFADHYNVYYKDKTTSGSWQTAVEDYTSLSYTLNIDVSHTYDIEVDAVCFDGGLTASFQSNVSAPGYSGILDCSNGFVGNWGGATFYTVGHTTISLNWTSAGAHHYEVWYQLVTDQYLNHPWVLSKNDITGLSHEIKDLQGAQTYNVAIVAVCRDGTKSDPAYLYSLKLASTPPPACPKPQLLIAYPQATSAKLGGYIYNYIVNETLTYTFWYNEEGSNIWSSQRWNDPAINSPYAQSLNPQLITNLKPDKKYNWFIFLHCHSPYLGSSFIFSDVASFRTKQLPPGPCNSVQGNYSVSSPVNNINATLIYSGNIFANSSIIQSSTSFQLEAPDVQFNQGFSASSSNNGVFIANAFDPQSCIQPNTNRADLTKSKQEKASVLLPTIKSTGKDQFSFSIFPNPASDFINIRLPVVDEIIQNISIIDVTGRTVLTQNSDSRQVNINKLSGGIYLYTIKTNINIYRGKLIKH